MAELASRYQVHPNMIAKWKREALDGVKETFQRGKNPAERNREDGIKRLQAKIGELVVERDFLAGAFGSMSADRRRRMIRRRNRKLSVARQCELVGMSRSSWYYRPRGESERNLALMRVIDRLYLEMPWYGSRQMTRELRRAGHRVGRKRVLRLMRLMGLRSVAPRPFHVPAAPPDTSCTRTCSATSGSLG